MSDALIERLMQECVDSLKRSHVSGAPAKSIAETLMIIIKDRAERWVVAHKLLAMIGDAFPDIIHERAYQPRLVCWKQVVEEFSYSDDADARKEAARILLAVPAHWRATEFEEIVKSRFSSLLFPLFCERAKEFVSHAASVSVAHDFGVSLALQVVGHLVVSRYPDFLVEAVVRETS